MKTVTTVFAAMAALMFAFATTAQARVIIKERTTYYNVSGKTGKALFASISKRGPKLNARHAIATTTSSIKLRNLKPKITSTRCRVGSVDVIANITYRYPRWSGERNASPAVRKAWKRFMKKVVQHEEIHGQIAKDQARSLERAMKRSSGRISRGCADFGRSVSRKFNSIVRQADRAHRRLDRRDGRVWSRNARLQRALFKAR
ncbi:DUF922 domain-containing protein [Pseudahrensia aquimaris]|uniref:DUF922 domain-containing protein n=1 Tax=Pseudahrensia aquimaris TaxID=744461 RepID=A0ABW3FKH7_9HYPH